MDDQSIIALYLARNERAITETQLKYGAYCMEVAYRILENRQDSEECVNDVYLKLWNSIPPHEPRSYLYTFLARITRHLSLNCCRDRSRLKRSAYICELSTELEQCLPAPDDTACRVEETVLGEALNCFLSTLSAEKRSIFLRRYWYMDSIADIAQRFSLSQSKVKTTLFRCRNLLREHLEKEGYHL